MPFVHRDPSRAGRAATSSRGDDSPRSSRPEDTAMEPVRREPAAGEARWPMAGAIVAAMVLTVLLPDDVRLGPQWVLPTIEGLLLVAVIAADPRSVTRRSRELRVLSIGLVSVLVIGSLWSTVLLIDASHPRRPADELGRRPARGRLGRVGVEQHRVRTALLGARRRRRGGARLPPAGAPGPRVPAAAQSGDRPARRGARGSSTTSTSASPTRRRSARPT